MSGFRLREECQWCQHEGWPRCPCKRKRYPPVERGGGAEGEDLEDERGENVIP